MLRHLRLCTALLPGLLAAICLAGCSGGEGKLKPVKVPIEEIVAVNIESECGSIKIEPGSDKAFEIEASYEVSSPDRSRREVIEDHLSVRTDISEGSLLNIYSGLSGGVSLRDDENADISLTVKVPPGIGTVVVQQKQGDIHIKGMGCAFSIVNENGSVTVRDSAFTRRSTITNVIGDVQIRLKNIDKAEEIRVSTDVGNIKLNVPKRASYTVTKTELSQKGETWKNEGGKTIIQLSTKVGKVEFQK